MTLEKPHRIGQSPLIWLSSDERHLIFSTLWATRMQVTCPACQKTLQSKTDLSGKTVKCPCGHSFAVPKAAAAAPAAAVTVSAAPAAKITVSCSCGKTLQAPAAAAGKAVKCPCGQVVKVPAAASAPAQRAPVARPVAAMAAAGSSSPAPVQSRRPAVQPAAFNAAPNPYAAPNPFGDMSDDEWKNMVQAHTPKQVDTSKPKEKSAAAKMLEEARRDTGQGDNLAMESALGFLNKTRGILVGLGLLFIVRVSIDYWLSMSMIDSLAGHEEPEVVAFIKWIVVVFCGIGAGVGVLFIVMGFLVSMLPLTCTISAIVIYTLLELLQLILDPLSLFSIRGWIFRIAIFGGLIQGINNAAYYRHLKAEEKAAKKSR